MAYALKIWSTIYNIYDPEVIVDMFYDVDDLEVIVDT